MIARILAASWQHEGCPYTQNQDLEYSLHMASLIFLSLVGDPSFLVWLAISPELWTPLLPKRAIILSQSREIARLWRSALTFNGIEPQAQYSGRNSSMGRGPS